MFVNGESQDQNTPPLAQNGQDSQQPQPQSVPPTEEPDAVLMQEEARLSIMQEDFEKATTNIQNEFEELITKNPSQVFSPEELEVIEIGRNPAEKFKLFSDKLEDFRKEQLGIKKAQIDKFSVELEEKRIGSKLNSLEARWKKANPNIDPNDFNDYLQNDMTGRQKATLKDEAGEDMYRFLELATAKYIEEKGQEQDGEKLPPNLSSGSGTPQLEQSKMAQEEYLRRIGGKR